MIRKSVGQFLKYTLIITLIFLASLGIGLTGGFPIPSQRKKDAQTFNKEMVKPVKPTKEKYLQ